MCCLEGPNAKISIPVDPKALAGGISARVMFLYLSSHHLVDSLQLATALAKVRWMPGLPQPARAPGANAPVFFMAPVAAGSSSSRRVPDSKGKEHIHSNHSGLLSVKASCGPEQGATWN
jgi:hypothetical protein